MTKYSFLKNELLKNFIIREMGTEKLVKLINEYVKILITINSDNTIDLVGFYKQNTTRRRGITRCGLLAMLEKLLDERLITNEQIMYVSSPTPDDGNLERLKKIYKEIGFKLGERKPGKPINLYSSIQNLVTTLKEQCEIVDEVKRPVKLPVKRPVKLPVKRPVKLPVKDPIIAVEKIVKNSPHRTIDDVVTSASGTAKKASKKFVRSLKSKLLPDNKGGGRRKTKRRKTKKRKTKRKKTRRRRK